MRREIMYICLALAFLLGVSCVAKAEGPNAQDIISQQLGALYIENTNLKVQLQRMVAQLAEVKKKCGKPCEDKPEVPPLPDKK